MGKLTISMAIFNSFVYVYQRVRPYLKDNWGEATDHSQTWKLWLSPISQWDPPHRGLLAAPRESQVRLSQRWRTLCSCTNSHLASKYSSKSRHSCVKTPFYDMLIIYIILYTYMIYIYILVHDIIWYDMIWYDKIWYDMICIWYVYAVLIGVLCVYFWSRPEIFNEGPPGWCVNWLLKTFKN